MTLRSWRLAAAACVPALIGACGGSTTINFVGDPDNTGGDSMGGDGSGGTESSGGTDVGGMAGDVGSGGRPVIIAPYCGDGRIDAGSEACDDGNEKSHDGCDAACEVEDPFVCTGEPSACTTVGNGVIDAGEECDDGNDDDDDGCSAEGAVEGECEQPTVLSLVDGGFGTSTATATGDTAAGGGTSPAQACEGLVLGAGSDRVFQFTTTTDNDLTVTVEADFDAIVRVYGNENTGPTCEPENEAFCIDEAGAGEVETWHYSRMPAGAHVSIVVDGANADEQGEFTLEVTQGCDANHVKLHRLTPFDSGGNTAMLSLKNTSDYCTVDLDTVGLTLTDDYLLVDIDLPQQALAPGEVFRGSYDVVDSVNPNAVAFTYTGDLNIFDESAAGAYLCDGTCDTDAGTNVTDAVLTGTIANLQIPFTTYLPGQHDVGPSPYESHVRVAYDGVAPNFLASDWSPAFLVDPDDYIVDWFEYRVDDADVLGPLTFNSDAEEGTVVTTPPPATPGSYSAYLGALPAFVSQPTYISFTVRSNGASSGEFSCFTAFGVDTGIGTSLGWGDQYDLGHAYRYDYDYSGYSAHDWRGAPGGVFVTDTSNAWHTIEYANIDWTNHTTDVAFDGAVIQSAVSLNDAAQTTVTAFSIRPWFAQNCQISDVVVRNGPPGRAWESAPVLP